MGRREEQKEERRKQEIGGEGREGGKNVYCKPDPTGPPSFIEGSAGQGSAVCLGLYYLTSEETEVQKFKLFVTGFLQAGGRPAL